MLRIAAKTLAKRSSTYSGRLPTKITYLRPFSSTRFIRDDASAREIQNEAARKEAVERVLKERDMGGYRSSARKAIYLSSAFTEQLYALPMAANPMPAEVDDSGKQPVDSSSLLDAMFDDAVKSDISNALLSGLVQRNHILLYAEDAWSEGYSLPLLRKAAQETGTQVVAVDIPDWAVMTSHLDPLFEDLTIVSHPYQPPPDLESGGRGEGMSFFAGINRKRAEEDEPLDSEEIEDDADAEEEAISRADSALNGLRARLEKEAGVSSDRLSPGDDEVSDPALSPEMMSNPLSSTATEQLDRILQGFVATPYTADGTERPRVIAIKHLGDLLNTRIGYTLFSRLVAAATRHNQQASTPPVVLVGLLHPSMFHPDVPPPGIPPFDVNPGTPVALMPRNERQASGNPAVINIVADPRDKNRPSIGSLMAQLTSASRSSRAADIPPLAVPSSGSLEELPLFARIGIPPANAAVQRTACDMRAPVHGSDAIVGSLRQALVARQCLDRNASVIRNICLLYRIPGFVLNSDEAQAYVATYNDTSSPQLESDGKLKSKRQLLHDSDTMKLPGRGGWTLDQRAISIMLHHLPDDIARRYFLSETFLHRWILLAQVLAVKGSISADDIRSNPSVLQQTSSSALIGSQHIRAAWIKMLQSLVALRQGVQAQTLPQPDDSGLFSLHRCLDFADAGIGRRIDDGLDVSPLDDSDKQPRWTDTTRQLEQAQAQSTDKDSIAEDDERASIPSPRQRIRAVSAELTPYEKRLMGTVIDPQSMATGFNHVCVKEETVTTLQEIITLPILRPEYFSRGVLQRHGVSGILLFGPPGTGKTMLAKAVARESGSVVLNIRGSDIYDKYFGEGEKLVDAVFSLARKLAPCVIFIDEVDALFSARSSGETNRHRRDIMNQIMSEWDGIASLRRRASSPQVMVMAATNRPFDLDDAILRRLPRRILVDLPTEADRVRILEIHLRGEDLDPDVDLKALAKRTQGFSGSDLKNVCVAAAQAALRERVRAEVATLPDDSRASAPLIEQLKRVPRASASAVRVADRHFDAALKKVAPSSSDQMESLMELRKWDKIYGDGAQERNRKMSIGFANAAT
ncbi:hypothetical protein H4R22_002505 [Coemansia sp. RSA 1290]|nr:hypothetical protein H4R22_002505 [Coemansia sp. RSA 1290]KAJ2652596.1 hypothetical protein IWW40_001082 [Coemansia sp. RSA 1250]